MQPETRSLLADVLGTAKEILDIAGPDGSASLNNRRDALAIERLFEIIGEALVRIRDREPEALDAITDAIAIIGMRNVITHGYDAIDATRIVDTIAKRVPKLISEVEGLI